MKTAIDITRAACVYVLSDSNALLSFVFQLHVLTLLITLTPSALRG